MSALPVTLILLISHSLILPGSQHLDPCTNSGTLSSSLPLAFRFAISTDLAVGPKKHKSDHTLLTTCSGFSLTAEAILTT